MHQYILQKFFFLSIGFLFIVSCKPTGKVSKCEASIIAIDTNNIKKDDSIVILIIAPYKSRIEQEMNQVIGYTLQAMDKGNPESLLNNLIADLILRKANEYYLPADSQKIDLCILNTGGFRSTLPKGKILKSNIYELMPFNNQLVVVSMSGDKMMEMFNYIVDKGGEPISGFQMGIKDTNAVNILINNKPFDKTKVYKVVTSDYLANGGDKMTFFNNPVKIETLNHLIRDAIIEYFMEENIKGNNISSKLDKRIYYE